MQPCWDVRDGIAERCSITVAKQDDLCGDTSCYDEAEIKTFGLFIEICTKTEPERVNQLKKTPTVSRLYMTQYSVGGLRS